MSEAARPLRILHAPVDLGGGAAGLARAQRALGHEAVAVSLTASELGFEGDERLAPPPGGRFPLLARERARFGLLLRSLRWADVIHCHFGQTILSARPFPIPWEAAAGPGERARVAYARALWLRDLTLWRALGKTVAVTYYGDDARGIEGSLARNRHTHLALEEVAGPLRGREALKPILAARFAAKADLVYAVNPDLLAFVPAGAQFLPYAHVDVAASAHPPLRPGPTLRFLHMPTNRAVKGTALFEAAVALLRAEGLDVELTLVEGVDHRLARAAIPAHDVLLDQLRVGWYGGVAVEAMAAGRPAVCFLNPPDKALAPRQLVAGLPLIEADPTNVADVLRRLAGAPREQIAELGRRSRAFAEAWHDPAAIAARTIADYEAARRRRG